MHVGVSHDALHSVCRSGIVLKRICFHLHVFYNVFPVVGGGLATLEHQMWEIGL